MLKMEGHPQVIERLRATFRSNITVPLHFRRTQLEALLSLVEDNEAQILEALHKDLTKPKFEAVLSEIDMVANELRYTICNLESWLQPTYVDKNLATKLDDCFIRREPLGVVLIIGAWNYPFQLVLAPLIAAIAAGSQAVARSILQAAAVHLTPVTLELGGKCPCLLYGRLDVKAAAKRLVWAKFFNAGQSCVAPDYVLCTAEMQEKLIPMIVEALEGFYGKQIEESPDYGRIVGDKHWNRLTDLLNKSQGKVVIGGESVKEDKYIAPTVLVDVTESDALMQEEIFGPILPILTFKSLEQGIRFINEKEKPLALYVFSDQSQVVNTVLEQTTSGGFCSNDGIVHMTLPGLPFGGVGASGMGSYHGRWGFETFSHRRACMLRGWGLERIGALRYPPYQESNLGWLRWATQAKKKGWGGCGVM
ncbi:Aldehyde dehydrogenase family 3 member B1 [Bagarius yarrelli]|uniref:Aldehyde dehydrogenase n=1 Tax=Bagarius yarrelli TaxID=175774 RepID=A0A556TVQ6_BAGYA|nr:Aldehyde dehydrogenase family 3 member B1 [Bagarius yarrelli]